MEPKSCCFTGHRKIDNDKKEKIRAELKNILTGLIKEDCTCFYAGGALGFDTIAALTVLELKKSYPNIRLMLVFSCKSQTKGWNIKDIAIYEYIRLRCDNYVYTSEKYTSSCMHKRNRYLVDNSSICVCYLTGSRGGTVYTVNYARQQGLKVINIADSV